MLTGPAVTFIWSWPVPGVGAVEFDVEFRAGSKHEASTGDDAGALARADGHARDLGFELSRDREFALDYRRMVDPHVAVVRAGIDDELAVVGHARDALGDRRKRISAELVAGPAPSGSAPGVVPAHDEST